MMLLAVVKSRNICRNSGLAGTIPTDPSMGSTITAARSCALCSKIAFEDAVSLKGSTTTCSTTPSARPALLAMASGSWSDPARVGSTRMLTLTES